jgi:CxxC-x17-CxxC domain-containing protein
MIQGDWQCAECGVAITELPFEPIAGKPILCKDCWRKKRDESRANSRADNRTMVQGDWQCAGCGKTITELPFRPAEGKPIYCRDCYRQQREQR